MWAAGTFPGSFLLFNLQKIVVREMLCSILYCDVLPIPYRVRRVNGGWILGRRPLEGGAFVEEATLAE